MKKLVLFSALPLVVAASAAQKGGAWQVMADRQAGYSVTFPAKPQPLSMPLDAGRYQVTLKGWAYESGGKAFIAGAVRYPVDLAGHEMQALDGATKSIAGKGQILQQQAFRYEGGYGRTLLLQHANGSIVRDTMLMKGSQLFQVMTVSSPADADAPDLARFSKSFKLLAKG